MRFVYLGREKKNSISNGISCVGYQFKDNALLLGFAFCSPGEHFSKKKARSIIEGRMKKGSFIKIDNFPVQAKYADIVTTSMKTLNDAMPEGYKNVHEYVLAHEHKKFPTIGGVKLPWWFEGVK